jgi:hypothetical protein
MYYVYKLDSILVVPTTYYEPNRSDNFNISIYPNACTSSITKVPNINISTYMYLRSNFLETHLISIFCPKIPKC